MIFNFNFLTLTGLFKPSTTTSNLFGATTAAPAASSPFQFNKGATTQPTGSLFGGAVAAPTAKPFGEKSATATAAAVNPFTQVANASAEANTAAKPTNLFSAIANTAQKTKSVIQPYFVGYLNLMNLFKTI